jgi:hypothetical protein
MSLISPMTWKPYAVMSAAGVLSMWFAATHPSPMPGNQMPAQPRAAAGAPASAPDIEEQAARLQARLQQEAYFRAPSRNLFRFAERPVAAPPPAGLPLIESPPSAPPAPPPLPLKLAGIASDQGEAGPVHTAILSTPAGVVLVRAGDDVLGRYRVVGVEEHAVELVTLADGVVVRLSIRP